MNKYTVDRFEDEYVILEDRETMEIINVWKFNLPENIKPGDIVVLEDGVYRILEKETIEQKELIRNRFDRLRKK